MNLYEKLLDIQSDVDSIIKDGKNQSDKYDFASNENVLDRFRPLLNQRHLLLIPRIETASLHEGQTRSGTARYLTEITFTMTWHDVESGEELSVPWYAQGVDLAGEKGVGKATTYAEKYFLLKFFHVPTRKDDPDNDKRTLSGEKATRGTAAAAETAQYHRKAILQMLSELYSGDEAKIKAGLVAMTKSDKRGYAGTDDISKVSTAALPVVYAKIKKQYESRVGHAFELKEDDEGASD
ncbi:MAG: ERF family protein [Faecousia sp.]